MGYGRRRVLGLGGGYAAAECALLAYGAIVAYHMLSFGEPTKEKIGLRVADFSVEADAIRRSVA